MDPVSVGVLSILPPVIAVVLALITKEVFSSLIVGILSGTIIYTLKTDGNIILGPVESALSVMGNKFDLNIVLFCSLLGALVYVIYMAGASKAYGNGRDRQEQQYRRPFQARTQADWWQRRQGPAERTGAREGGRAKAGRGTCAAPSGERAGKHRPDG